MSSAEARSKGAAVAVRWTLRACALALLAVVSFARQTPPATDWNARFDAAVDERTLGALVDEMAALAAGGERAGAGFDAVYVAASQTWLSILGDRSAPLAEQREVERKARAAATAVGKPDDLADLDYGWALQLHAAREAAEADRLLESALTRAGTSARKRFFLMLRRAELARGDVPRTNARLDDAERGAAAIEDENERSWARCEVDLARVQLALDLGTLDTAQRYARAARDEPANSSPGLLLNTTIVCSNVALAVEDYGLIESMMDDRLLEYARRADPAFYATLLVRQGIAKSEAARPTKGVPSEATDALERALAVPGISVDEAITANLVLADLALRGGDGPAARARLAAVDPNAASNLFDRTKYEALRAATALLEGASREELRACADELERQLDATLQSWRAVPLRRTGIGPFQFGSARLPFSEWIRLQLALDPSEAGIARALGKVLDAQSLGTLARTLNATTTVEEVRRVFAADGRGLLVYWPSMDRSHLFCVDSSGLRHELLPSQDRLLELANQLNASWSSPPSGDAAARERRARDVNAVGREAAKEYLPQTVRARMATWTSCLIVGGDLCGDPAFECLVLDDGRPLGLTLALDYLSSLPASQKQAAEAVAQRSRAGLDAVVIAAPFHSAAARQRFADLNAIELGPSDLDRLTDSFERSSSSTGADASLTALRSDAVRNARLLSVLAHGAYDARNSPDLERPSVVILASAEGHDGIVRSADFEQLQVPPFVELLACGPARGPARLGDAVASHLVGACFTAGADTVLAARVDVELEPTIEFASVMHRRMREFGLPPDRAALEARREIATRPERADPWYWAALQVHGIGWVPLFDARPKSSRTPLLMAAAAVIGITAAAGGFALSRRRARRHQ